MWTGRINEALEVCEAIVEMLDATTIADGASKAGDMRTVGAKVLTQYSSSVGALVFGDASPWQFRKGITALIQSINRVHRPDIIFRIIDNAELLYGLCITPKVLNAIMHSAVKAVSVYPSWESWRPTKLELVQHYQPEKFATRQGVLMHVINNFEHIWSLEAFRWRGAHPGLVARQLFHTILKARHPSLCDIQSPIPVSCGNPLDRHLPEDIPLNSLFSTEYITTPWTNYIRLLGRTHLVEEIPLVLAWMKALDVRMDADTFGFAHGLVLRSMGPKACNALMAWVKQWQGPDWKLAFDLDHWSFKAELLMSSKYGHVFTPGPASYPPMPSPHLTYHPRY